MRLELNDPVLSGVYHEDVPSDISADELERAAERLARRAYTEDPLGVPADAAIGRDWITVEGKLLPFKPKPIAIRRGARR